MDRNVDLDAALEFVIGRIEEEAKRSLEPLDDEQRYLLTHLPTTPTSSPVYLFYPELPVPAGPRDLTYERLCALAKAAHAHDLRLDPSSALDWDFAASVSKLNGHPMSWLLQWAGVKVRRPWWDRSLLILAPLLFFLSLFALALVAPDERSATIGLAVLVVCGIAALVFLFFASRGLQEQQLKRTIERCRRTPVPTPDLTAN
jgi:hypothetical protein